MGMVMGTPNLDIMRERAAELYKAPPEALEWFRYGATYVVSLLALVHSYTNTDCDDEARDVAVEIKEHQGASDGVDRIARNLLRLGIYWDELQQVKTNDNEDKGFTLEELIGATKNK